MIRRIRVRVWFARSELYVNVDNLRSTHEIFAEALEHLLATLGSEWGPAEVRIEVSGPGDTFRAISLRGQWE